MELINTESNSSHMKHEWHSTPLDSALCIVHSIFSLIVIFVIVIWKCRNSKRCVYQPLTYCQNACTVLAVWLLIVQLLLALQSILLAVKTSVWIISVHCYCALGILGTSVCLAYCEIHLADKIVGPVHIFYFFICLVLETFHVTQYTGTSTGLALSTESDVRFLLTLIIVIIYLVLFIIQLFTFLCQKCNQSACKSDLVDDLSSLKYVYSYEPLLSKSFFHWLNPLLLLGFRRSLCLEDLGHIPQRECTEFNFLKLKQIFQDEMQNSFKCNRAPSLWRCLWLMSRDSMIMAGVFKLISDLLIYVPPISLDLIVSYVSADNNDTAVLTTSAVLGVKEYFTNGYVVCLICFIALLLNFLLMQQNYYLSVREGIRCKAAIQAVVFDKSLRLMTSSINEGQIMNHMTVDAIHLVMFFNFAHYIWTLPLQIIFGFLVLYAQLGKSALISCGVVMLAVPLQYFLALRLGVMQKRIMDKSDERLKKSNELLQSIRLLKLYAWEKLFYESVHTVRRQELRRMLKAALIRVISITFTDGIPYMACLMTFALYHRLEAEPLQPGKVFSGIALFSHFANQLFIITLVINIASQAYVSVKRLRAFLVLSELKKPKYILDIPSDEDADHSSPAGDGVYYSNKQHEIEITSPLKSSVMMSSDASEPLSTDTKWSSISHAVKITNGCFSWNDESSMVDVNVTIPIGKLTMIIGPIGSGKSSLLCAMLGEMKLTSGTLTCNSQSLAVVTQSCWILNATVRENILFGLPFDLLRYNEVIEATGLQPDLKSFTNGDETEIGEKGTTLSGGQRQRIAIARALYADADIIFLDDCLSALDAIVSAHVFDSAILKLWMFERKKTVVFVTHDVRLLARSEHLIAMKQQKVVYEGSYDDLMLQNPELYSSFVAALDVNDAGSDEKLTPSHHVMHMSSSPVSDYLDDTALSHLMSCKSSAHSLVSLNNLASHTENELFPEKFSRAVEVKHDGGLDLGKLVEEEEHMTGSVSAKVYIEYIKAASWFIVIGTLLLSLLCQAVHMAADIVLSDLVDKGMEIKATKDNDTTVVEQHWSAYTQLMMVYIAMSIVCIILVPLSEIFLEMTTLTASRNIHHRVLKGIIAARLQFFDRNPVGRILNRLSADMNVIDEKLTGTFETLLFCTIHVVGGIILSVVFVPYIIVPVIPVVVLFIVIQRFFIASCRELQRLDCITRSPVLAHVSQTLAGLTTVRTFRNEKQFLKSIWEKIDANQLPFLFYHTTNMWMGVRLDVLGACIVLAACLSSVTSSLLGFIAPGMVGLVIAYAIMISAFLNWMMRGISETEIYFNSVERIVEYSNLESEPSVIGSEVQLPSNWPTRGDVHFKAVDLKYNMDQEPVVKNVTLHIRPGQKIGICGRTGSGKTSLTMSLFRAVFIASGEVLLDGVDITKVPLETIRSKLSIIPQEPVLFSGTVRFNLDPLGHLTDEQLWNVLQIAQLEELVRSLPSALDTIVAEGGDNFSTGQRQLFCLARALSRKSKVLVMDEATASIDIETDRIIQNIVQEAFSDCTVLIIAHRISTIQNCDLIVVLKDGCIIEKGSPHELSSYTNGTFARMLADNHL